MNIQTPPKHAKESNPVDAYTPAEIAKLVESTGMRKAKTPLPKVVLLAILAGAFISFGAMLYALVITGSPFGLGPTRWLGGIAFSLGLILVVVGGAELFTGNNLVVMAWAGRHIKTRELLMNWAIVYFGNLAGALATAGVFVLAGMITTAADPLSNTLVQIAQHKADLDFQHAFFRGLLCNVLVCLAVWLCMAAHSVSGKILSIIFPVSAFVALGFEHSVANMFFIPVAIFSGLTDIGWTDFYSNLVPVTLGNIIGGSCAVALIYWVIYLRE